MNAVKYLRKFDKQNKVNNSKVKIVRVVWIFLQTKGYARREQFMMIVNVPNGINGK